MKMIKVNVKSVLLGFAIVGTTGFVSAQTDTAKASETVTAVQNQAQTNPNIEALKKQVETDPKNTDALAKLATAYQEASDWNNSIETWKKISVLLPDWAPSYYSQAYAYQSAKDDANAKVSYEKYIAAVKPEEIEASKKNLAYAHFYLAFSEQKTNPEKAKENIAKSLKYDPSNEEAIKLNKVLNS